MSDKKITELTAIGAGSLSKDDVIPVVAVSGTPITKKSTISTLFSSAFGTGAPATSNIAFTTTTPVPALSLVSGTLTANVNTNATAVLSAGAFATAAGNAAANTAYLYGLQASTTLQLGANVMSEVAAAKLTLDTGNVGALIANTYGLVISHANTSGTRAAAPRAFICMMDSVQTNTLSTQYLLEISADGVGNVSSNVFVTSTNNTVTRKLKIRVHGTDYWLLVANNAS